MDYLGVVLNGYFNDNHREHLEKYFFREYKKAEKEQFFDADEFFSGCEKVIQKWEKHLQDEVYKRQHELYKMLSGAKNKTMSYGNLEGKTIEQKRKETIEYCEKELKEVRPDGIGSISFTVHLMSLTSGRVAYNMPYNEVLYIKNAIEKAFQKVKNQNEPLQTQPKQKKDKKYSLTTFWNEKVKDSHYYKSFKSQIDSNGFFQVKTNTDLVKIYTPELAVILTSTDLETIDQDTQKESEINGKEYLKTYIEAYHLGEQYFDAEIKVSPNILYGANAEQYVRDIHLNYFHAEHRAGQEGWVFVKKSFPFILNNELIYDYGYYSGIVNKVDEQVKKYPQLFKTFDNCEHKIPPQPIKTKAEILKEQLSQYGFFELEKVKALSEQNKGSLLDKITESDLPYAIAMFDYLKFIQYLERKHFSSKSKLNKEVAKWFNSDKDGRAVKGNISSLLNYTNENKSRYTAHKHKENVIKDYELLK